MILRYNQSRLKMVLKVVHGLIDTITRTKTKNYHYEKIMVRNFFCAVYHNQKKHVISHSAISAILDVILNIFTTLKKQSNSPNTTTVENYQKTVINCNFDFMLNFAFKMAAILDTILNISIICIKPMFHLNHLYHLASEQPKQVTIKMLFIASVGQIGPSSLADGHL